MCPVLRRPARFGEARRIDQRSNEVQQGRKTSQPAMVAAQRNISHTNVNSALLIAQGFHLGRVSASTSRDTLSRSVRRGECLCRGGTLQCCGGAVPEIEKRGATCYDLRNSPIQNREGGVRRHPHDGTIDSNGSLEVPKGAVRPLPFGVGGETEAHLHARMISKMRTAGREACNAVVVMAPKIIAFGGFDPRSPGGSRSCRGLP
jgi:hypothetical protein